MLHSSFQQKFIFIPVYDAVNALTFTLVRKQTGQNIYDLLLVTFPKRICKPQVQKGILVDVVTGLPTG
jgi:hypothetical protein